MMLQSLMCPYEVEAFNKDEVILQIKRSGIEITSARMMTPCHIAYWNGMTKTLVGPQWATWEEDSPAGKIRVKIARKIDKFC